MKTGWKVKKLGEVCTLQRGFDLPKHQRHAGNYPLVSSSGVIDTHEIWKVKGPGVATGRSGSIGDVFYVEDDYWPLNTVLYVKDFHGNDVRFIYYLLKSFNLARFSGGTGVPTLNRNNVHDEIVYVPSTISEQQRIVAILDDTFAAISKAKEYAEKNLQNARELFESKLNYLFTTTLKNDERITLSELLERGWIISHLDGNHGSEYPQKVEFKSSGVPYISANCIKGNHVNMSYAKFLSNERAALIRKGVAHNRDVLFAHNATVGPVAVLYTDEEKIILGTSLTYYRCNMDYVYPEYLAHYLRSPMFVSQYSQVMRQSTRNQIPITKQRDFTHVIPEIGVQKEIANKLDELFFRGSRLEAIYQKKISDLEELKKSVLQKAFSGDI